MRRGARPCGHRSPGPGRATSGGRSPHYKSQKAAGPPRPPAPSPERRAGDGNGRGDAPVSGRRGRPRRCPRPGKRPAGLGAGEPRRGAAPSRRRAGVPRADMAGENPGFPRPPASRLPRYEQSLKSAPGNARGIHACCGRPSWKSQLLSPPVFFFFVVVLFCLYFFFFFNRGLHWVMRSRSHYATTNTSCNKNSPPPMNAGVASGQKKSIKKNHSPM